jgi:tripartite-type tricarboxylate transporter receptor subunit TctC
MKRPETVKKMAELGAVAVAVGPDEFAAYIASETKRWRTVIEAANIKMN